MIFKYKMKFDNYEITSKICLIMDFTLNFQLRLGISTSRLGFPTWKLGLVENPNLEVEIMDFDIEEMGGQFCSKNNNKVSFDNSEN